MDCSEIHLRALFESGHDERSHFVESEKIGTLTDYTKIHLRALSSNLVASNQGEEISFVSKREKERERNSHLRDRFADADYFELAHTTKGYILSVEINARPSKEGSSVLR